MKIVMRHQISGTRDGKDWPAPGGSIDLPADEAQSLIDLGMADVDEAAAAAPKPERRPAAKRAEKRTA